MVWGKFVPNLGEGDVCKWLIYGKLEEKKNNTHKKENV